MDAGYLAEDKYGATSLKSVAGVWAIIVALVSSIILVIAASWKRFENVKDSINQGTMGSIIAADLQYRLRSRLRRCHGSSAGFPDCARLCA